MGQYVEPRHVTQTIALSWETESYPVHIRLFWEQNSV